MRVLAVTHGPLVGPELFGDVIAEAGHELLEWEIGLHGIAVDSYESRDGLRPGDQNVGELPLPVAAREYDACGVGSTRSAPLFGVCLSPDTSHALGRTVSELPGGQLAGFYETTLTAAAQSIQCSAPSADLRAR